MNTIEIEMRDLKSKPNQLRAKGMIPGALYGPEIENTAVKATLKELKRATSKSGEVYQVMSKSGPVFVRFDEIQRDPVTHEYLHFSLVEMPQGVKNDVKIPMSFEGIAVGSKKGGVLEVVREEVTLHGMPSILPDQIKVDVSSLDIGDKITIADLSKPANTDILEDKSEVVVICRAPVTEAMPAEEIALEEPVAQNPVVEE